MELAILGLAIVLMMFFLLLGLNRKAPLITLFAGLIALITFVNIAFDSGKITYVSGGDTIVITLGTWGAFILGVPALLCFLLAIGQWRS